MVRVLIVDVIMLTALNDSDVRRRSLRLGASDYLVKPLDLKDLARIIHEGFANAI
jgi:DNA-binding response OmpR family regulator